MAALSPLHLLQAYDNALVSALQPTRLAVAEAFAAIYPALYKTGNIAPLRALLALGRAVGGALMGLPATREHLTHVHLPA